MNNPKRRYLAAGMALVRASLLRRAGGVVTRAAIDPDDPRQAADMVRYLRELAADPVVREALAVSSSSLDRTLTKIENGATVDQARLRRTVYATTRYLLRMSARATPFGLMAGVAVAEVGQQAKVRIGAAPDKGVRPDSSWLHAIVTDLERRPEVLRAATVTVSDLTLVRGDRLSLLRTRAEPGQDGGHEMSVRLTPAVREALAHSRLPIPYPRLVEQLLHRFPGTRPATVENVLGELLAHGFLVSDLRPPPDEVDPLGYLLDRLATTDVPELPQLLQLREHMEHYSQTPLGRGLGQWRALCNSAQELRPAETVAAVDLALDVDIRLPRVVTAELERAAGALWTLGDERNRNRYLTRYHADFVARYGHGRLVPLLELLDPQAGLGPPATYRFPPGTREILAEDLDHSHRDELRYALVQEALHDTGELVLDDEMIEALGDPALADAPTSVEMYGQLCAPSAAAIDAGDFRLVLSAMSGSFAPGATFGRFVYLFGQQGAEVETMVRWAAATAAGSEALLAQLTAAPLSDRHRNVTQVSTMLPYRIPAGGYVDRSDPSVIAAEDLLIGADKHRLYLVSRSHGREVSVTTPHMLNPSSTMTNAARFIGEVARAGERYWHGWRWGQIERLPHLPRVRYGRTVLCPARWRTDPRLNDGGHTWRQWERLFQRWRARVRIPDRVLLTEGDNHLALDLNVPLHLRLIRQELRRRPAVLLVEDLTSSDETTGWLDGYANEFVVPLVGVGSRVRPTTALPVSHAATAPRRYPPGSRWVYAKLYLAAAQQDELLARQLPTLLESVPELVDRWFFIRYADPEPHLRLRFHIGSDGETADAAAKVLALVCGWAERLRASNQVRDVVLDTYEPELHRYGGPELMTSAERLFRADSEAAIVELQLRIGGAIDLSPELLAAASHLDLLCHLHGPGWQEWLLEAYPRRLSDEVPKTQRASARRVLDPSGDWKVLASSPGGRQLLEAWRHRARVAADYGDRLQSLSAEGDTWVAWDETLRAVLHMHHNRTIGVRPETEQRSYGLARAAVRWNQSRRRHDARNA
ncbi:thiopeptide-type bacteriocin biosynthesis domain-containing protein [Micromonospora viridifaciens]|uniref:Thiopeptide-type bacteriocin biosynthesis domain-containing protein n=1 Tax=Micromonospora viridifaciens TaxID=1881 RepID=A0A1C4YIP9_MICVI|nr:lantibiotic dehydratase [Micromonospora viridifaciens]SCF20557.1 thiopeptide-type bacteriocin biosynthesis domain-containing protein [Micromonospora viridifaciens]